MDDIAVATRTAAWLSADGKPTPPCTLDQTLRAILRSGSAFAPAATRVVLEATGSQGGALVVALHEAGYRVAVINPCQAQHCAKAQLRRAKTDELHAQDVARLAAKLQPPCWDPPPAVGHEVRQRLVARVALVAMRQQARYQRHALLRWPVIMAGVRRHLDEVVADLDRRITALEGENAAVLGEGTRAASFACLMSAPGIGLITAA